MPLLPDHNLSTGSAILDNGRTPEEWAEYFSSRGIKVEADTIRKKANETGHRHKVFGKPFITAEHMDKIILEATECPSKPNSEATSTGLLAVSNTTANPSQSTSGVVLDHLKKQGQKTGSRGSRRGKSAVTSLDQKRTG